MKREIIETNDGSKTLFINNLNENYHSTNGALNEAVHVFINNGIKLKNNCDVNILELGFGTGLNLLVTFDEYLKNDKSHKINYYSIEKYPVQRSEIEALGYDKLFENEKVQEMYFKIHDIKWNELTEVYPNFFLKKINIDFFDLDQQALPEIDLVYYDCFGAKVQPELWEKPIFELVAKTMKTDALLTTYSSKGSMKRALKELGFEVTKRPGPAGKRDMITAVLKNKHIDE